MEKMDINKLKTFYYVALEGSYQKAAVHLGINPPYISKQIKSLEENFKIKLFKRSRRSLIITEAGKVFLESAKIIMRQLEHIEDLSNIPKDDEDNVIRIVTTTGVTSLWLVRKIKDFINYHPKYKIRIITTDENIDVTTHFADVAIIPKFNQSPDIVHKKLFTVHSRLFASEAYLKKFGTPTTTTELDQHRLMSFYHNEAGHRGNVDWHLKIGTKNNQPRVPFLVINSAIGLYEAAVQGIGIFASTEEFPYLKGSNLIKVLPKEGVEIPVYYVTHVQKARLSKVLALEKFFYDTSNKEINNEYHSSMSF